MSGRLRGQMAEIMGVISAHLPPGESFGVEMSKPIVTVLRGVPAPVEDLPGALAAYREQLRADPGDEDEECPPEVPAGAEMVITPPNSPVQNRRIAIERIEGEESGSAGVEKEAETEVGLEV